MWTEAPSTPPSGPYQLRKRSAAQLEAMRPVTRPRRTRVIEVGEVDIIDDRRGEDGAYEYRVVWSDSSADPTWLPREHLVEDGLTNLLEVTDMYFDRYPNKELPYQAFISRNARAYRAMADNEDNSCVPHAIQMALELLGYGTASLELPTIWKDYVSASPADQQLQHGFRQYRQLKRYCTNAAGVPKCGVQICIKTLDNNLFDGNGSGPMALVNRVLPDDDGKCVLGPGVYIVGAYKRNMRGHCFAMQVTKDEDIIVREDGEDTGLGDHHWMRLISYIRQIKVVKA